MMVLWLLLVGCTVTVVKVVDGDGDGFYPPTDCDDDDPEVYLGAPEIQCDGVDQNCDGMDLFVDADGDSGAPLWCAGGTDCNDIDPSVFFGAPEVPYDGVDQDCDGEDLLDVDGDGYEYADDCDDEDASVHPRADEVAYDGIDQDCDGVDLTDVDGDGFDGDGGPDCDDLDPDVSPSAEDVPGDGIDQNCDGYDAGDLAGCARPELTDEVWLPSDAATTYRHEDLELGWIEGWGWYLEVLDFDGDGQPDVALGGPGADQFVPGYTEGAGEIRIVGNAGCGDHGLRANTKLLVRGDVDGDQIGYSFASGDFDQDGVDDLVVGTLHSNNAKVIYGGQTGDLSLTEASGSTLGSGWSYVFQGDFNGDGVPDVYVDSYGYLGYVTYGPIPRGSTVAYAEGGITAPAGFYYAGTIGDFDGDGLDDLGVTDEVFYAPLGGAQSPGDGSAIGLGLGEESVLFAELALDHDGDGVADIVTFSFPEDARHDPVVTACVLNGSGALSTGSTLTCIEAVMDYNAEAAGADLDGDGMDDFVLGKTYSPYDYEGYDESYIAWVMYGREGGAGHVDKTSVDLILRDSTSDLGDRTGWGEMQDVGDWDGDGLHDLVFAFQSRLEDGSGFAVLLGAAR